MKTIEDVVREHARMVEHGSSTLEAIRLLELPDKPEFNSAGNLYLAALSIINKLQDKIERLDHEI